MDTSNEQVREGRATGRLRAGRMVASAALLLFFAFTAGCAVVEPPVPAPLAESAVAAEATAVKRLEDGSAGYVIEESSASPTPWRADFDRAVALMQAGREDQAVPILEQIVARSPGVTAPYINLARAYRHSSRFEAAEALLQKALELVPGHPVASNEYGLLLRRTGRFAEAREVYLATLRSYPEFLPVRRNLGILCELYLDDPACAIEQYTIYSQANPDDRDVALWIADLNLRTGRN